MIIDETFDVEIDTRAAVTAHRDAPWTEPGWSRANRQPVCHICQFEPEPKRYPANFPLRGGLNVTFATDSDLAFAVWRRRWLLRLRTLRWNRDRWNRPHYPHRVTSHRAIVDGPRLNV